MIVKNFGSGPDWVPGTIAQKLGPLTYIVDVSEGRVWKRHVDHIKELPTRQVPDVETEVELDFDIPRTSSTGTSRVSSPEMSSLAGHGTTEVTSDAVSPSSIPTTSPLNEEPRPQVQSDSRNSPTANRRYPSRRRQPPDRLEPQI